MILGCESASFEKRINGDYYLKKINFNGVQFIAKRRDTILQNGIFEIVVPDYVFAVGSNQNLIVAKQHYTNSGYYTGAFVDTTKTQFFIIDLKKAKENVYGPLWEYEFENKVIDLNGEMIEFDMVFSEIKK